MVDAFTVATGAVGVISLGLSVCQGLLAYYGPFKTFHEQISDIESRITALEGILKVLQRIVNEGFAQFGHSTAQSTTVAFDFIWSCQDRLNRLQIILQKCTQTNGFNICAGVSRQVNRLLYPFRRETLMALMESLDSLQATLNTSLQMLTISMITSNQRQINLMVTSFTSSASNTRQILEAANRLDQSSVGIDNRLKMLERQLNQEMSICGFRPSRTLRAALLRTASATQQEENNDTVSPRAPPNRRTWNRYAQHVCPLYKNNQTIVLFSKQWIISNKIFKLSILASLTIQKGAEGFSISPNLQFRPIVPSDSPVFRLLWETEKNLKSRMAGTEIERTQKKLLRLFMEGEGAHLGTLPDGNTILHVITGWQVYSHLWDDNSWLIWRALINAMLQAGQSPNQVNDDGKTPADLMVRHYDNRCQQQATLEICSDLLNSGGYMTHRALDWRHQPNLFLIEYYMRRCDLRWNDTLWRDYSIPLIWNLRDKKELQDIDLPEELQPLIYRSRDQLLSLLEKGVDFQTWVESYTQWPPGLALLLQYGHTPTETCVVRACEADCEESLQLLISTGGFALGPSALEVAAKQHNIAISKLVVQALAGRRRQLRVLADSYLPDEVNSRLDIGSDCLLDAQAYDIYQLLKKKLVGIDDLEMDYEWSVYDCIGANLDLADLLWDTGFRHVDRENKNCRTCLMNLWSTTPPCSLNTFLMKADWFITKGADLNRRKSGSSTTALHCLAYDVGGILRSMQGSSHADLMRRILVDSICDDCCCPCSLDGCSGLTRLLDGFFRGLFPTRTEGCMKNLLPILETVLKTITPLLEPVSQERLAPCVLRIIACQALEICPEEIYEIQDEEKDLISTLGQLLDEFLPPRTTLLFPDSLATWWTHVNNAISLHGALSEEEISKILDAGVVLHR
ncbi:hypothetical protein BDW74DRAFT_188501 [Aspergillus multicolor]|uniref:uncharacterized protein n=1 Tax=Aspergillus multicolor TaxID=41759 RepID=UPI003CCE4BA0